MLFCLTEDYNLRDPCIKHNLGLRGNLKAVEYHLSNSGGNDEEKGANIQPDPLTCLLLGFSSVNAEQSSGSLLTTSTPYLSPTPSVQPEPDAFQPADITGTTRYVSPSGNDNSGSNTCASIASPCKTIQRALNASIDYDTVKVASGIYTFDGSGNPYPNVVIINSSVTLSGGWNDTFTSQVGASTIDGENTNNGILASNPDFSVIVDRFAGPKFHFK